MPTGTEAYGASGRRTSTAVGGETPYMSALTWLAKRKPHGFRGPDGKVRAITEAEVAVALSEIRGEVVADGLVPVPVALEDEVAFNAEVTA